jgi:4-amino-4-deoxy-L-arabinose transferase-like glycosyltransferase
MNSAAKSWKWDRFAPWLLVLVVLAIYLPGTAQLPLVDRDEPRFATAAREMLERHDWIVPTFNGEYRFDKPALVYWLMHAGYATVGINELGARLPAVACMLALVLLVWQTGRRWFGARAGFAAGFMLATSLQFFIHGRLAVADMPMVLAVAVACVALAELLLAAEPAAAVAGAAGGAERGEQAAKPEPGWSPRLAWWSLWVSLGLGFLGKGPITLVVPALALGLWRWVFWRKPLPWARLQAGRGLVLATAIVALWGIPALVATHGLFWQKGIGEHVVQRGLEKLNGRSYNPFFYLMTAPLTLFPWVIFAGAAWVAARREWDARRAWLASWLLAPYVIFTAYLTQLPHYVLPGFPAFFLLLGAVLTPTRMAAVARWARVAMGVFLAVFGLAAAVALVLVVRAELPAGLAPLRDAVAGLLVTVGGFLLVAAAWWGRRALGVGLGVVLIGVGAWRMGTGLRAVSPGVTLGPALRELPAGTRYLGCRFAEPSIVFYSGAKWVFSDQPEALATLLARPGPVAVVVMERECDPLGFFTGRLRWRDYAAPDGLAAVAQRQQTVEVFNLGRSRWQTLSVWVRP